MDTGILGGIGTDWICHIKGHGIAAQPGDAQHETKGHEMKITVQNIMDKGPCIDYPASRITELFTGKHEIELSKILGWDIPTTDRIWGVTAFLSDNKNRLFAADCVESVLHIYEAAYPDNDAPRKCIQGVRDFIAGIITQAELNTLTAATLVARDMAWAARMTRDAAWVAQNVVRVTRYAALATQDVTLATQDVTWAARYAALVARNATRNAAWAARDATLNVALVTRMTRDAARDAAWVAEGKKQIEMLKKYCEPRKDAENE